MKKAIVRAVLAAALAACAPPMVPVEDACAEIDDSIDLRRGLIYVDNGSICPERVCIWAFVEAKTCDPELVDRCHDAISMAHDCAALEEALYEYCWNTEACR